jgi:hypothetical protein
MPPVRRLAAILAADVAGYSRLMGADEEGTHERLKAHRRELVDPKIGEHSGRIVKTTGDGMLVEFPSVVDAVRCAGRGAAGDDRPRGWDAQARRIRFRVGINLGDAKLDEFGSGTAQLEEAVVAYRAALEERTRDRDPFEWALTQSNLGTALTLLGERESGTARLEEAVAAFRAATRLGCSIAFGYSWSKNVPPAAIGWIM